MVGLLDWLGITDPSTSQSAPPPSGGEGLLGSTQGGVFGQTRPQVPTWDQYNQQRQSFGGLLAGILGHGIGPGIAGAIAPDSDAMGAYNAMLGQGQATETGRLNLAPYERQLQPAQPGTPASPAMSRIPAAMGLYDPANATSGATQAAASPQGQAAAAFPWQAATAATPAAPQAGIAGNLLDPVSIGQRINFLSQFPGGLESAMKLYPILDSINQRGTGIDANGNQYRLGGANSADAQRSGAVASGEAPYKALEALMGQAGRAVQIEPGGSVATGFQNMPPQVTNALTQLLGRAGGGAGANGGASGNLPAVAANGPPPAQMQRGTGPGQNSTGFPTQPGSENGRLQNPLTLQGATMQKTVLPEQFKAAADHYQAAQGMMGQLDMIDHNLDVLNDAGWSSTGAGANAKMSAFKTLNGLSQTVGMPAIFDPNKIATWEDFNKESTRMGFELAKTLGSREAMQIVQQAVGSVPNSENTYLGGKLVSSSLRQAAQRQSDYYEFLNQFAMNHGGNTMGADVAFNKTNPVGGYVKAAIANAQQGKQSVGPGAPTTKTIGNKTYTWTP